MALDKAQRDWACVNMLNTYLFDKVWNEPFSEFRINIKPTLIKQMSQVGSFSVIDANIRLPVDKTPFYIWAISAEDFNTGLKIPSDTWTSLTDVCNVYRVLIHMYGVDGSMFHKGSTYLMWNNSRTMLFIAAKKHMVQNTIAPNSQNNVYLTVYYDSDFPNDVKCLSLYTTQMKELPELQLKLDTWITQLKDPAQLSVYVGGKDVTDGVNMPILDNLTYYDFIIDENILFQFDIDLVQDNQDPVFLSEKDKTWKQLVHIPKELNPDNKIITHNTCDFTVYKRYSDTPEGLYLHRASYDRTVSQVTHNDMAIPLFILDAYRDYLQTQEIRLKGVVRIHNKDNILLRDASYIDLLYNEIHSDEDIIRILCGGGPEQIPWWKADQLEQSKYVEMMFDTPNLIKMEHVKEAVDALGFYQVVNILCKRILDTTITDAYTGVLTHDLPILYTGMRVVPLVYLNGVYVPSSYVTHECDTENNTVRIEISKQVYTKIGDKLTVILFVDGDSSVIAFTPTKDKLSVDVPFDDALIHYSTEGSELCRGVNQSTKQVYVRCEQGSNIFIKHKTDTGCRITFADEYIGKEFYIQSAYSSFFQTHNLKEYTETGRSIAIPIQTNLYGYKDRFCPIFDFKNVSAYLNGKYLIRNIDYFINEIRDKHGNLAFYELVIQTMDYFEEGKEDTVDVLFNVAEIEDNSFGFSIKNRLQDESPVNLYFPNISAVHVDGELIRNVDFRGIYVQLLGEEKSGQKFEIQTSVPQIVKDFILEYAKNEDFQRIEILNEYFYPHTQLHPAYLVLEGKHRIYSVFVNTFIWDIMMGNFGLASDPDVNRMTEQLKPYAHLKEMDLCYQNLDQRFIDYYPQYVNYEVPAEVKLVVDQYIKLLMPKNIDPTLEVVYVN